MHILCSYVYSYVCILRYVSLLLKNDEWWWWWYFGCSCSTWCRVACRYIYCGTVAPIVAPSLASFSPSSSFSATATAPPIQSSTVSWARTSTVGVWPPFPAVSLHAAPGLLRRFHLPSTPECRSPFPHFLRQFQRRFQRHFTAVIPTRLRRRQHPAAHFRCFFPHFLPPFPAVSVSRRRPRRWPVLARRRCGWDAPVPACWSVVSAWWASARRPPRRRCLCTTPRASASTANTTDLTYSSIIVPSFCSRFNPSLVTRWPRLAVSGMHRSGVRPSVSPIFLYFARGSNCGVL